MPWLFASYPSPLAATARDGSSLAPPRSSTSRASSADSRRAKICSRERRSSRQDQISAPTLAPTAHHSVTGTDAPTARPSLHLRECLVTACGGDDSSAFGRAARVVLALPPTATAATPPQQAVWSVQVRHCSSPPVRSSNISFCLASSTQAGDETLSPTPPFEIYTEQLRLQFALCSSSCRHGTAN